MLPLPVQVWLAADAYEGKNDNTHISATTLLKDSHKIVLENKVEKNYDTSDEALLDKFASKEVQQFIQVLSMYGKMIISGIKL